MIWGKGRSPLKTWNLKAQRTFPDGGTNTAQGAQKVLTHHPEAHRQWEKGGGDVATPPKNQLQCQEDIKPSAREELSPPGNVMVMEEGFARAIFQHIIY